MNPNGEPVERTAQVLPLQHRAARPPLACSHGRISTRLRIVANRVERTRQSLRHADVTQNDLRYASRIQIDDLP